MKTSSRSYVSVCVVAITSMCLAAIGCTVAQKTPPAAKKTTEPYRVEKEGKTPPLAPSDVRKETDREESYQEMPVAEDSLSVETVEPVNPVPPSRPSTDTSAVSTPAPAARKMMGGYRVQVFASGNEASARSVGESVMIQVGVPAYVELIDGVYKVRVGDCPTREEADALLKKCRDAGYGDAWVATCQIFIPKKQQPGP